MWWCTANTANKANTANTVNTANTPNIANTANTVNTANTANNIHGSVGMKWYRQLMFGDVAPLIRLYVTEKNIAK